MNKALLGALLIIASLASCKKAEDQTTTEDTIRGTWARTSGKAWARNPFTGNVDTTNYTTSLPSCVTDDALEFKANYLGSIHLGGNVCNAGDPESVPFRWETINAGNGLRIYDVAEYFPHVSGNVNSSILTLVKGFMTLRYTRDTFYIVSTGGVNQIVKDTITYTDVFKKQ